MMKLQEIRDRSDSELVSLARQIKDDLYKHRVQKATNQLSNTDLLRQSRRDYARVMTIMQARKVGVEAPKGN